MFIEKAADQSTFSLSGAGFSKALYCVRGIYSPSVQPMDTHKTSKDLPFLCGWTWRCDTRVQKLADTAEEK